MKRKKMKLVLLKDLTLTFLVSFTLGLIIIFLYPRFCKEGNRGEKHYLCRNVK